MTEPWASPDAATPRPATPPPVPAPAQDPQSSGDDGDVFPIPLRPLSLADTLDTAFEIIRARPRTFAIIAIVFVVPGQVLLAWYSRDLFGGATLFDIFEDPDVVDDSGGSNSFVFLALLVDSIVLPFVAAAAAHVIVWWGNDGRSRPGRALAATFRRTWALFAGWLLAHLLQAAGILAVWLGTVAMIAFTSVVAPVIAVEAVGPARGISRSFGLVAPRFFPTLWRVIVIGVVATTLGWILAVLPVAIGLLVGVDVGWIINAAAGIVTSMLTTSFVAVAAVVMYFDLRIRREGMDVQMRLSDVFGTPVAPRE